MGEYIKYYEREIYLGICESIQSVCFQKYITALHAGKLTGMDGNDTPTGYAQPNRGYFFRFPFPDETTLPFGEIKGDGDRGLPITIERGEHFAKAMFIDKKKFSTGKYMLGANPNCRTEKVTLQLCSQKVISTGKDTPPALVLMFRCPYSRQLWSIVDAEDVTYIIQQIYKHYISEAKFARQKIFWLTVVNTIMKGYEPLLPKG